MRDEAADAEQNETRKKNGPRKTIYGKRKAVTGRKKQKQPRGPVSLENTDAEL